MVKKTSEKKGAPKYAGISYDVYENKWQKVGIQVSPTMLLKNNEVIG